MTVYDNLAFPLRNRGVPEADVDRKVREIARDDRPGRRGRHEGARADRRPEAEDLARPRPGALRRQRDPVRRAADRHRPAHEMGAALAAEAAPPPLRLHHGLRHPRPDRGADLRRPGGGDVRGRDRADRHAGRAVRAAAPHLRRLFHRLAGHERACRSRSTAATARLGSQTIELPGAPTWPAGGADRTRHPAGISSGSAARACRSRSARSRTSAATRSCAPASRAARSPRSSARTTTSRPIRRSRFDPTGINIYADSWRVEMGA